MTPTRTRSSSRRHFLRNGLLATAGATAALDMLARQPASAAIDAPAIASLTGISMVGDSLTYGSLPYQADAFSDVGWAGCDVDAYGSRGVRTKVSADPHTGLTAVDAIRATTGDTYTWVIALGTNDCRLYSTDRFTGLIGEMLDRIGPEHRVMWVNVFLPAQSARQQAWNSALASAASTWTGQMIVYDWASVAAAHSGWLTSDKVHYTASGYKARSAAVAQASVALFEEVSAAAARVDTTVLSPGPIGAPAKLTIADTPTRAMDSRVLGLALAAGETRVIDLAASVPAGVTSVVLNVTVSNGLADGYVSMWAHGATGASGLAAKTLDFSASRSVAGQSLTPVSEDRRVALCASASADVIVDVLGWFSTGGTLGLSVGEPQRLLDTRSTATRLSSGETVTVTVPAIDGVPPVAAWLHVTAANIATNGHVTAWAAGAQRPSTSNLNFLVGDDAVANGVHVALDAEGRAALRIVGSAALIVDLVAVYSESEDALWYQAVTPTRLLDTRSGIGGWSGTIATDQPIDFAIAPLGTAIVGVLAATPATQGHATIWSGDGQRPSTSSLNLSPDRVVSACTLSLVSSNSTVAISTSGGGGESLVYDVNGWFVEQA